MSYGIVTVAEALAATLKLEGVTTYASPPLNLNPPALVVSYADGVDFNTALRTDTATIPVIAVVGFADPLDRLDALVAAARAALYNDRKLGGAVALARMTQQRTIRADRVGGIDVLTCDLVVVIEC